MTRAPARVRFPYLRDGLQTVTLFGNGAQRPSSNRLFPALQFSQLALIGQVRRQCFRVGGVTAGTQVFEHHAQSHDAIQAPVTAAVRFTVEQSGDRILSRVADANRTERYLIFYREHEGVVRIERVMHGARDIGGDDFDVDD